MSKLFKKLNEQTELNLIKESLDLNQDIIFSDILETARESQINEATYTSYRDYYRTMYKDHDRDRKRDLEFRKSEEDFYDRQRRREREDLKFQYQRDDTLYRHGREELKYGDQRDDKIYDQNRLDAEKAKNAEKDAKKAEEQNKYSVKFREILNDFEVEVDEIVRKCKDLRDDLPDTIDAAMEGIAPDRRDDIEKMIINRYNNEISRLDDEVDHLLRLYRGKINRLNDETPDCVRTRGTSELNEIRPNIAKYKKGSK